MGRGTHPAGLVGAEGPLGWDGFVGAAASSFVIVSFLLHCRDNIREFAREPNAGIAKLHSKTFGSLSSAGAIAAFRSSIAVIDVAVTPVLLVLAFFWFLVAWHAQSDQAAVSRDHVALANASAAIGTAMEASTLAPVAAEASTETAAAERLDTLATRSGKPAPELLAEALDLLEQRYGRTG